MAVTHSDEELMREWRETAVADTKLPRHVDYVDGLNRPDKGPRWPEVGGAKYRYYYKELSNGEDRLVRDPNHSTLGTNYIGDGRPRNRFEDDGYREVWGDELLAIIDKQQARNRETSLTPEEREAAKKEKRRATVDSKASADAR